MASVSRSRLGAAGIPLVAAGVAVLLVFVLPVIGVALPYRGIPAIVVLAVAVLLLALLGVDNRAAMITLFIAGFGLVVYAVALLGLPLPGGVMTLALFVGIFGFVAATLVLFISRELRGAPGLALIVAAVLVSAWLFFAGDLQHALAVAAGIALAVTGVLFVRGGRSQP